MTRIVHDRQQLRAALGNAAPGLVPTMGALHEGHLALIRRSAAENDTTVVSVFVNPTQFNDPADLERYPRDLARDIAAAAAAGADMIYAPAVEAVYPPGFATAVDVSGLTDRWEGAHRPGHFRGVATVVTILLQTVRPARAYFGEKDWQQLQVVRRLHADLLLPGEIVGCPTIREPDGLALSSRNVRLSPDARRRAALIPQALARMAALAAAGERDAARLIAAGTAHLQTDPSIALDYLAVVDPATLEPVPILTDPGRALIAAYLDGVRLIDNLALDPGH